MAHNRAYIDGLKMLARRELSATCIHTASYGTRSSTLVAFAPGCVTHYLHADGAPCTTPYADITGLLGG